jgi:hypothetical protein
MKKRKEQTHRKNPLKYKDVLKEKGRTKRLKEKE